MRLTEDQKEAIKLIHEAVEMVRKSGLKLTCSVDVSAGEHDYDHRAFGDFMEINSLPSNDGFGSNEIQLNFEGGFNFNPKGKE